MNVSTILISQQEAQFKLDQYKSIVTKQRTKEDDKLQSLYAAVSKGARVINIANAFKETGLNDKGQPKLAIARADWKTVYCFPRRQFGGIWRPSEGNVGFTATDLWDHLATRQNILLPDYTFNNQVLTQKSLRSPVPHIPPACRPRYGLHNYHILFEVENWEEYPVDPFLLRRISGYLFVVEAEWELTELEASLLGAMMQGN